MSENNEKKIIEELVAIKKLLILTLYADNIPSEEINKAVGIGAATIRGMFSKKKIKKAREREKK